MSDLTGLSADLHNYLQQARDAMLRALDGLSEYDARRPATPSGTNILGLIKHLTGVELGYLCDSVGRPSEIALPWNDDGSVWESGDMWARSDESRAYVVGLYREAWAEVDASIAALPLDAPATVAWWSDGRRDSTFGHLLVRVTAETAQHAGHADIIRELADGSGGRDRDDMGDEAWWASYIGKIQASADAFRE